MSFGIEIFKFEIYKNLSLFLSRVVIRGDRGEKNFVKTTATSSSPPVATAPAFTGGDGCRPPTGPSSTDRGYIVMLLRAEHSSVDNGGRRQPPQVSSVNTYGDAGAGGVYDDVAVVIMKSLSSRSPLVLFHLPQKKASKARGKRSCNIEFPHKFIAVQNSCTHSLKSADDSKKNIL